MVWTTSWFCSILYRQAGTSIQGDLIWWGRGQVYCFFCFWFIGLYYVLFLKKEKQTENKQKAEEQTENENVKLLILARFNFLCTFSFSMLTICMDNIRYLRWEFSIDQWCCYTNPITFSRRRRLRLEWIWNNSNALE